ncbi:hypothetical protein O1611_g786 [Lasiodiplodia mahajangana]|uniref:Uncharacterized protein n=1 Tax=Lasiodiplodia mahajangana TaxID=1108764 RepID=A0ACC2JZV9_9PEZI|nr:hypothetical protein O1611_g786 [Lasiodiplodia mahajangana]
MAEVRTMLSEPASVTTSLRTNLRGPPLEGLLNLRAKFMAIQKKEAIDNLTNTEEASEIAATDEAGELANEVSGTCASVHTETDSGYGTTPFDCDATKQTKTTLTFSRKPIPQQYLDRLFDIRVLFTESLLDIMSTKQRPTKGASMKLKYADHDDGIYLVIQCDERDKKMMRKFFAQSHVKETVGDDINIHITTGLRQLSTHDLRVYARTLWSVTSGTMIQVRGENGLSRATIGGAICVVKDGRKVLYGMTASHILSQLIDESTHQSPYPCSDPESDSDTSCDSDDFSHFYSNDESDVLHGPFSQPILQIGGIAEHSIQSASQPLNYDWALVELGPDYSACTLNQTPSFYNSNEEAHSTMLEFTSLVPTPTPSEVKVIIPTSRGTQRGVLTPNTSSLCVAPGRAPVETHDIVLDDGFSLEPGDSGSWVIQVTTGVVYGHVVYADRFGEAYAMPFDHTLRDIRVRLRADLVGLPREFENLTDTWKWTTEAELQTAASENVGSGENSYGMAELHEQLVKLPQSSEFPAVLGTGLGMPIQLRQERSEPQMNDPLAAQMDRAQSNGSCDSGYDTGLQLTDFPESGKRRPQMPPLSHGIPYKKPKTVRVFCDQCDVHSEGFRGEHELRRHKDAEHRQRVKKFICVDPSTNGLNVETPITLPLEDCRACRSQKKYGAYYNAAAHLRRKHFQKKPSRSTRGTERRGGKGSGDWPPMSELSRWMKEIWVDTADLMPLEPEEESSEMMEVREDTVDSGLGWDGDQLKWVGMPDFKPAYPPSLTNSDYQAGPISPVHFNPIFHYPTTNQLDYQARSSAPADFSFASPYPTIKQESTDQGLGESTVVSSVVESNHIQTLDGRGGMMTLK